MRRIFNQFVRLINNMKYIYHFTSKDAWDKIKQSKKLLPQTIIEWVYDKKSFTKKTLSICKAEKYTVGFPKPFHKGWLKYGLWDEIFRLIKCDVLLKIRIPENSKGFVREHSLCSPKGMKEKYGEDLYFLTYSGKISFEDTRIKETLIAYRNSAVRLSEYKENFEVPEIWIPEQIPLKYIEEVPFRRK